jgi:hypothetical protein
MAFFKLVLLLIAGVAGLFILADLIGTVPAPVHKSPSLALAEQVAPRADLSAKDRYIDLMLNFQYRVENAFHAGICGIRSERYVGAFRTAQSQLSIKTAQRLGLSAVETSRADAEVNRRFAKIHEGAPEFNLAEGCAYLRASQGLVDLDGFYSEITGTYH